jgi:hypothetical protein
LEDRESLLTELDDDTGPTAEAGHDSDPTMQAPDRQQFVSYHISISVPTEPVQHQAHSGYQQARRQPVDHTEPDTAHSREEPMGPQEHHEGQVHQGQYHQAGHIALKKRIYYANGSVK